MNVTLSFLHHFYHRDHFELVYIVLFLEYEHPQKTLNVGHDSQACNITQPHFASHRFGYVLSSVLLLRMKRFVCSY